MRLIAIIAIGVLVTACSNMPSQFMQQSSNSLKSINQKLDFSQTGSRSQLVDKNFRDDAKMTMANTDFETPKRLERELQPNLQGAALSDDQLKQVASDSINQLFPNLEFRETDVTRGSVFQYVSFQQTYLGRDIVGAQITLRLDHAGNWITANSSLVNAHFLSDLKFPENVKLDYKFLPKGNMIFKARSVVYPRREKTSDGKSELHVYAARELQIYSPDTENAYLTWVDENTNEVLGIFHPENTADKLEIHGDIVPNAPDDTPIDVIFPNLQFEIQNQKYNADENGDFDFIKFLGKKAHITLDNPFVAVVDNGGPNNEMDLSLDDSLAQKTVSFNKNSTLSERNIYYWVNIAHSFVEHTLNYHKLTYQMVAMARFGVNLDNAFFNPLLKTLVFGEGKNLLKNTALSRDVILHEYGHAVTDSIYGTQAGYEFSAMNEAFSDYFAATITNEPRIGEGELKNGQPYLRDVENNYSYKTFFQGNDFHRDGQLFSGALWDLRKALGEKLADQMIHEARLAKATTVTQFYMELRLIDESKDDGDYFTPSAHADAIRHAFMGHGLNTQISFTPEDKDYTIPWKSSCWTPEAQSVAK